MFDLEERLLQTLRERDQQVQLLKAEIDSLKNGLWGKPFPEWLKKFYVSRAELVDFFAES